MTENDDTFSINNDFHGGTVLFSILLIGFGIYLASESGAFWPLLFPTLLGIFILFSVPTHYEISANRITRRLSITRNWGIDQSNQEIPFEDILNIAVKDIARDGFPEYYIEARLKNGNVVRLTDPTGGYSLHKKLKKSAQDLEMFIKNKKMK